MDAGTNNIESRCRNINSELAPVLSWKWDERFGVILGEFLVADADKVSASLLKGFDSKWDYTSIKSAPSSVKKITKFLFGMSENQLLFTHTPDSETVLFAAWWPWGNKEKISVRLGATLKDKIPAPDSELVKNIKNWFGVK